MNNLNSFLSKLSAVSVALSGFVMSPLAAQSAIAVESNNQAQEQRNDVEIDHSFFQSLPLKKPSTVIDPNEVFANGNSNVASMVDTVSFSGREAITTCLNKPGSIADKFLHSGSLMEVNLYGLNKGNSTIAKFITQNGDTLVLSQDKAGQPAAEAQITGDPTPIAPATAKQLSICIDKWARNPEMR